jgi:hypothetical protein
MSEAELLDRAQWRSFRLFLVELEDPALDRVYLHAKRELIARRERENDITRLFFSSSGPTDLATAQQTIQAERRARAQDRKTLAPLSGA